MERIGKAISQYSADMLLDQLRFFELTIFCYLTGNNDMHLKNFSMILSNGNWVLAQAYDLLNVHLANPKDKEELALSMEEKKIKFIRYHFERFGANLGLNTKQIQGVFNRLEQNKPTAKRLIDASFLSGEMQESYWNIMFRSYQNLY